VTGRRFKIHAAVLAIALVVFVQGRVFAGTAQGVITGRITDWQGESFAGARVQAKHIQNGTRVDVTSNADGHYSLQLPEGTYEVSVHVAGMKTFHRDALVVRDGSTLSLDVQLEEGPTLRTVGEDGRRLRVGRLLILRTAHRICPVCG
jgi:hypothetical protein